MQFFFFFLNWETSGNSVQFETKPNIFTTQWHTVRQKKNVAVVISKIVQ